MTTVQDLTNDELKALYKQSLSELGLLSERIPGRFVILSAVCARNVIDRFCEKNDLTLQKEPQERGPDYTASKPCQE